MPDILIPKPNVLIPGESSRVNRSLPIMDSLVVWYDFTDRPGSPRLTDKSGNDYHGTLDASDGPNPQTLWKSNEDGTGLGDFPVADLNSKINLAIPDLDTATVPGFTMLILQTQDVADTFSYGMANYSGGTAQDFIFIMGSAGTPLFRLYTSTLSVSASGFNPRFRSMIGGSSVNGKQFLYYNGVNVDDGSRSWTGTRDEWYIGSTRTGGSDFGGTMEWVAYWTRVLSDGEIAELYQNLANGNYAPYYEQNSKLWVSTAVVTTISGTGQFSATPAGEGILTSHLSGEGDFTATPDGEGVLNSHLSGEGQLSAAPAGEGSLTSHLAGEGQFSATPAGEGQLSGVISIAGTGQFSATPAGEGVLVQSGPPPFAAVLDEQPWSAVLDEKQWSAVRSEPDG